ncbi:hypothetical protein RJT34_13098 [Clitoria ternatea]|uniref:Uncharacterized protein n=1 Tax=Clitoria ternatea TaxID=43366 RepID=A0AAN9JRH1_CLITE
MEGHKPTMLVTDQDLAMKIAVEKEDGRGRDNGSGKASSTSQEDLVKAVLGLLQIDNLLRVRGSEIPYKAAMERQT